MRYLMLTITVLILLLSVGSVHADTWIPPANCDDQDREISGNRQSPCKFPTPEFQGIEYRIRAEYPNCISETLYYIKGLSELPDPYVFLGIEVFTENGKYLHGNYRTDRQLPRFTIHEGYIVWRGNKYDLASPAPTGSIARAEASTPVFAKIQIRNAQPGYLLRRNFAYYSNIIPYPSLPGAGEITDLFNACLAELEHEAVKREANRKATISAQSLAALHQEKIQTAENELLKTQALKAELEYREAAGAILQEIVRIRLAGKADRVKLLNEHLERVRQSSEEFDVETAEIEAMIQKYIDFNEALMAEIDGYQTELQRRIQEATRDIANQQAELDALNERAKEISIGSQ